MSTEDRSRKVSAVVESLERDLELLCLTGVEDKLQENVRPTLELLKNAGIKVKFIYIFIFIYFYMYIFYFFVFILFAPEIKHYYLLQRLCHSKHTFILI